MPGNGCGGRNFLAARGKIELAIVPTPQEPLALLMRPPLVASFRCQSQCRIRTFFADEEPLAPFAQPQSCVAIVRPGSFQGLDRQLEALDRAATAHPRRPECDACDALFR